MEKTVKLANGNVMPRIGFGTWKLANESLEEVISNALETGFRYFDLAQAYCNDADICQCLGTINRKELFISDKLWNTKRQYSKAVKSINSSLKRSGMDYFDLYLIHWPASQCEYENWQDINLDTWKAMEEMYEAGMCRAIGVSNFMPHHLDIILEKAKIKPMINQLEYHPGYMQKDVVKFCSDAGILVEAWSPLGNGGGAILKNEDLQKISEKYQRSIAQICLRWCLQNGVIPITKASSRKHMIENQAVFDFEISNEDMERINSFGEMALSGMKPDQINDFS